MGTDSFLHNKNVLKKKSQELDRGDGGITWEYTKTEFYMGEFCYMNYLSIFKMLN